MKTAYFPATGEIQAAGSHIDHLALEGLSLIDGFYPPGTGYVNAGVFVPYTTEQLEAREARKPKSVWSNTSMSWESQKTLDELKESKWISIKEARNAAEFGTFYWDGSGFDGDSTSLARLQLAALGATLNPSQVVDWTLADNTVRSLTATDILGVMAAYGLHVNTTHETGRTLRESIEAATTPAEVEAVQWPD